jgi:hypothetical protein
MRRQAFKGLRTKWLRPFLLTLYLLPVVSLPAFSTASGLADTARQLARKIAAATGPGTFALAFSNQSSLEERTAGDVRAAIQAALQAEGVSTAHPEQAMGTVRVVLSESLREYVWTAEISIGADEKKIALVSLARSAAGASYTPAAPIILRQTLILAREQPILDAAVVELPGGSRLLVLGPDAVVIYRHDGPNTTGRWEVEGSIPIAHTRVFPRDARGRLLLRRDHLFDAYLPGVFCRSTTNPPSSLTMACADSDDPWPLTADENSPRAFFAASRNFFTGALSPGVGKIVNVPSFYDVATLPRSGYALWIFTAVDGSLHLVDGVRDEVVRGDWGSELAAVRSGCGTGTQLVVSGSGTPSHDSLRVFEMPDRDPVAVGSAVEFDGPVVALWTDLAGTEALTVVRRKDNGWYEAHRISIVCGNQ